MPDVAETLADLPVSESPEEGVLTFYGVEVFPALYWVEDGDHVFRSTEFDLLAADRDQYVAIQKFIEMAEDLAGYYSDLTKAGRATEAEADIALEILSRINEVLQQQLRLAQEQLQVDDHPSDARPYVLKDVADRLRVERDQVEHVLEHWTHEELIEHLRQFPSGELKPPALRR